MGQPTWQNGTPLIGVEVQKHGNSVRCCLDLDFDLPSPSDQLAGPDQISKIKSVMPDLPDEMQVDDAQRLIDCIEFIEAYLSIIVEEDPRVVLALIATCFRDKDLTTSAMHWKRTGELKEERLEEAWNAIWNEMVKVISS